MAEIKLSPTVKASFELLNIDSSASQSEIKKAYHKMALLYHPDRNANPEAPQEFQKVTQAYDLLTDPSRVKELNRRHLKEKLHRQVVDGIEITFGSFFGYRLFDLPKMKSSEVLLLGGSLTSQKSSQSKSAPSKNQSAENESKWNRTEVTNSILDHPAYDALEVVYAGKFSAQDEARLKGQLEEQRVAQMPWVVLNNQGILRYLAGDLRGSKKCYLELCQRVPNNIIFMYRLGLCYILEGFKNKRRTLLGSLKPDRILIEKGIELLKHCIKLGDERPVGRQNCFVIRKTLADVYERTGQSRKARKLWRDILEYDEVCAEAVFKLKGRAPAIEALKRKRQKFISDELEDRKLLNPSSN